MSSNRLPYFPFDVGDYLNDPAVLGMSADTEGLYIRLLARMWQSATPGRVAVGIIHELTSASRLAEQYRILYREKTWEPPIQGDAPVLPEEIGRQREEEVIEELAAAFDTSSEPGIWVQKRMVIEWKRALTMAAARRKGADLTNKSRNNMHAERTPSERLAVGNREVEGEREEEKKRRKDLRMRAQKPQDEPVPEILPAGPSWTWEKSLRQEQAQDRPGSLCDPDAAHDAVAEFEAACAQANAAEAANRQAPPDFAEDDACPF